MHTVLIVDDEYGIRELLSEILEDEGYQVLTAENAKIAQSLVGKHDFDLILLDIWMPDMDGISLLKEWYSHNTVRCPIVMMSGHGTIETAMEATRFGAMDFLEKPISMQQLLKTCKQMIQFWEHEKVSRPRENEQAKAASVALAGWKKASCSPLNVSLANLNDKSRFCDHFILTDVPLRIGPQARLPIIDVPELHFEFNLNLPLRELRDNLERAYITRVAQFYGGSVTMLAKHAGLERTHLYRKIRQLGLELKKTTRKDESDHIAAGDTMEDLSEETSDTPDNQKCFQIHQKTTDVNNGSDDS